MYLSHNIVSQVVRLETSLLQIKQKNPSDRELNRLAKAKFANTLFYIANSMGINITLKDAEKLLGDKTIETNDFRGTLLAGFRSSYKLTESLAKSEHIGVNSHIFGQINYTIGKQSIEDWKLKYRESGDQLSMVYEDLLDAVPSEYKNINSEQVVSQLSEEYSKESSKTRLYKFSYIYYNLVRLHPFMAFNKYSLVLIGELLLGKICGWDYNVISIAELFAKNNLAILKVMDVKDEASREVGWHELILSKLADSFEDMLPDIKAQEDHTADGADRPFLDLNKRQLKVLKYLQTIPTVKREDYVQMMDVSTMTAYRDLNMLLKHKLIKTYGSGRGTKYMLSSR